MSPHPLGQKHRLLNGNILEYVIPLAKNLLRGYERLLDINRRGCHWRTLDLMINQVSGCLTTEVRLEQYCIQSRGQTSGDQWVQFRTCAHHGKTLTGQAGITIPVPRPLKRICRQCHSLSIPESVETRPVDADTKQVEFGQTLQKNAPWILSFSQRRQPGNLQLWQTSLPHSQQAGRRPNLQNRIHSLVRQTPHPIGKADGVSNVTSPVTRVRGHIGE